MQQLGRIAPRVGEACLRWIGPRDVVPVKAGRPRPSAFIVCGEAAAIVLNWEDNAVWAPAFRGGDAGIVRRQSLPVVSA